ncbi:MAG TPA: aminoacyl-tRNA hydrolase [Sporomusaceae bacterium]|jgi:PTH1 family peptidyl-tRNA hydrolase|uniref:aminoacyl-tRNA hydrolase n=1 Tax=Anaerospora sp. TaxID=1960278 RepID=UPI000EEBC6E3|nr:aminoacyl-tRNA hydrolase [Anaerospora sp.]HAK75215.1 aminoacyl-tRNA hydrolase [Sporomusaceae bacterium]
MKIIVGLGNPGREYSATRHNAGFLVVDELARRWNCQNWKNKSNAQVAEFRGAEQVLLVKPQTYMNLSGTSVGELARWYKVDSEDIVVIFDDLDLPVGRLRLRMKGGSGGHRGIESLLTHLSKDTFARVRLGIGRPPEGWEVADYVLSRFTTEEEPLVEQAIAKAADAVESIIKVGLTKTMNLFNK